MNEELVKVLGEVGFADKEAQVYLALLTLNEGTVQQIAKSSGLKRPIIYVVLEGLIKRGYASEIPGKKKARAFQAAAAATVLNRLQANMSNFTQYLPIFKTLGNRGRSRPKISYLDNKEGILNIYEDMNYTLNPFFITSYARIEEHFPGTVEGWIRNYTKGKYKKLRGRHVVPDNERDFEVARKFKEINQEVRALPNARELKMDFTIYSNKLAISNLGADPFLVLLESEDLVQSMRAVFELVWRGAREIL